jgi:hypothetical protein
LRRGRMVDTGSAFALGLFAVRPLLGSAIQR